LLIEFASTQSLKSLKTVIVAGEECAPEFVRKLSTRFSHLKLFNEYGPTEATVWCTAQQVVPGEFADRIPIGRSIANTRIYIVDRCGHPVPAGVGGELCVAGEGVSRGYWRHPEQTKERFVTDLHNPKEWMYRTGDLAKSDADGTIYFLGRIDEQIKIRGFRIEPGEIEEAIKSLPFVKDAVVALRQPTNDVDEVLIEALENLDHEVANRILIEIESSGRRLTELESHFQGHESQS
jgi:non-ribosomal peptide synthetase component F